MGSGDQCISSCDEMADAACYQGQTGCADYRDDKRLAQHCGAAQTCRECLSSDVECVFLGDSCYSSRNMYSLPESSVREYAQCDQDRGMQQCKTCTAAGKNWYPGNDNGKPAGCHVSCAGY